MIKSLLRVISLGSVIRTQRGRGRDARKTTCRVMIAFDALWSGPGECAHYSRRYINASLELLIEVWDMFQFGFSPS